MTQGNSGAGSSCLERQLRTHWSSYWQQVCKSVAVVYPVSLTLCQPTWLHKEGRTALIYTRKITLVSIQVILSMNFLRCLLVMSRPISWWPTPFSLSLTLGSKAGQINVRVGFQYLGRVCCSSLPPPGFQAPKCHMILSLYLRTSSLRFRRAVT